MLKDFLKKINSNLSLSINFPLNYMIPVYHLVSEEKLPHVKNIINYKNPKDFENDLDFMLHNFDFVDWDVFKKNFNKKVQKPYALLTFDDGLIEFKDIVMPILLRKGIYAIEFINPAFVDNTDMMFRMKASLLIEQINKDDFKFTKEIIALLGLQKKSKIEIISKIKTIGYNKQNLLLALAELIDYDFTDYSKKHKIYMNEQDLQVIKKEGFGIAAHSWDHPYFTELSINDQLDNTQKSINFIKDKNFVGDTFAFPFSDVGVNKIFFESLFNNNSELAFTFSTSGVKLDDFTRNLHRIAMENGRTAEEEIRFESNYFFVKNIFNKNLIKRK